MEIYFKITAMVILALLNTGEHVDSRRVFVNKSFPTFK